MRDSSPVDLQFIQDSPILCTYLSFLVKPSDWLLGPILIGRYLISEASGIQGAHWCTAVTAPFDNPFISVSFSVLHYHH